MTSVNSPACLLARNHFYRNVSSSPDPMKTNCSTRHKQRHITVWVTMATPPRFPGGVGTRVWVSLVLGPPSSPCPSITKPPSPANRGVK